MKIAINALSEKKGSPDLYGPFKQERDKHEVVYKRWECSPCMYFYRTDAGYFCDNATPCLHKITSNEIIQGINKYIK